MPSARLRWWGSPRAWPETWGRAASRVNNVQPGPTDTDMNPARAEWAKGTVKNVALGRYAQPEEVANFVAYLASPEVSYITGASVLVDGGYSA